MRLRFLYCLSAAYLRSGFGATMKPQNSSIGSFFASLTRTMSTGSSTIPGIITAHESLSSQAPSFMELCNTGEGHTMFLDEHGPWLDDPLNYKILPLWLSIIVIMD